MLRGNFITKKKKKFASRSKIGIFVSNEAISWIEGILIRDVTKPNGNKLGLCLFKIDLSSSSA